MAELTRKDFYNLAKECRDYAMRLATHDQDQVDRKLCLEFNAFLARVKAYDRLQQPLARLQPARPITRGMVLAVVLLIWLLFVTFGSRLVGPLSFGALLGSMSIMLMAVFIIPPSTYGTSVEAIEGKVLVVVEALQTLLESGQMEFTEAAYFSARDTLREAAAELRQQVYLNRAGVRGG